MVSFIIKKIGVSKIRNILPAQVVGPMIIVIGVNLIPTALDMAGVNSFIAGEAGSGKALRKTTKLSSNHLSQTVREEGPNLTARG